DRCYSIAPSRSKGHSSLASHPVKRAAKPQLGDLAFESLAAFDLDHRNHKAKSLVGSRIGQNVPFLDLERIFVPEPIQNRSRSVAQTAIVFAPENHPDWFRSERTPGQATDQSSHHGLPSHRRHGHCHPSRSPSVASR